MLSISSSPDGLIITLYSDDVIGAGGDEDFNDLIVHFTYRNPEVNPAGVPRYPFIMPPGRVRPPRPLPLAKPGGEPGRRPALPVHHPAWRVSPPAPRTRKATAEVRVRV